MTVKNKVEYTYGDYSNTYTNPSPPSTVSRNYASIDNYYMNTFNGDFKNPTNFSRRHDFTQSWNGTLVWLNPNGTPFRTESGFFSEPTYPYLIPTTDSAYNQAVERLYDSLRGGIDLSIDLMQYKSTLGTVNSLSRSIEDLTIKCAKAVNKYGSAKRAAKALGGLWLQWQYGIKPTVSTLHDLIVLANTPGRTIAKVKGSGKEVYSNSSNNPSEKGTAYNTASVRCRIEAEFAFRSSSLQDLAKISSLNPVSIGWESIPFSFVVDWVIDIGGYLRSLESAYLYRGNYKQGYVRISRRYVSLHTYTVSNSSVRGSQSRTFVRTTFDRSILSSGPVPSLPSLNVSLGTSRLLSAASILSQFLPTGRKLR